MSRVIAPFDHVAFWIQEEERVMSYDVLVKWCSQYPEYAEQISTLFLDDTMQRLQEGEVQHMLALTDEERYSEIWDHPDAEEIVLRLLREQGRPVPPAAGSRSLLPA